MTICSVDGYNNPVKKRGWCNAHYLWVGRFGTAKQAAEAARAKRIELFTHNELDRSAKTRRQVEPR